MAIKYQNTWGELLKILNQLTQHKTKQQIQAYKADDF